MPRPYMPDLRGVASSVNWGKSSHWDIYFETAPAPFSKWFPAYEVDRSIAALESFDFVGGTQGLRVPMALGPKTIQLSFYDDHDSVLESWLDRWVYDTIHKDGTVATITEVVRKCYIAQLNAKNDVVHIHVLDLFPEGEVRSLRDSQSGATLLMQTFNIAGYKRETR